MINPSSPYVLNDADGNHVGEVHFSSAPAPDFDHDPFRAILMVLAAKWDQQADAHEAIPGQLRAGLALRRAAAELRGVVRA